MNFMSRRTRRGPALGFIGAINVPENDSAVEKTTPGGMNSRSKTGGTLGIIVASIITIILLGICFFFVAQVLGGSREHANATDAGALNVAKYALTEPIATLSPGIEDDNFKNLGENGAGVPGGSSINLRTYNRLFAQTLLVVINAQADTNPQGKTNANLLVAALQQGADSIGGRLGTELSKTTGNVLFKHFDDVAKSNSVRMLGDDAEVAHSESDFKTAYLEQDKAVAPQPDTGQATNIEVPPALLGLFSGLGLTTAAPNGGTYLRGYEKPTAGLASPGGAGLPVGVPLAPGERPHLVSKVDFERQESKFADLSNANVPPNGFRNHSTVNNGTGEFKGNNSAVTSWSIAGAMADAARGQAFQFPPSIPMGYIEIVNADSTNVPGPYPGDQTWLMQEGANETGGTMVMGQCFGNQAVMASWKAYNTAMAASPAPNPPPSQPSLNGVFSRATGATATLAEAQTISGAGTTCTDVDVTGGGKPVCQTLWGGGSGIFDQAYHPGGNGSTNPAQPGGLTAIECADCGLEKMFNQETQYTVNCPTTGLRIFNRPCAPEMTTSPKGTCSSTVTGTIQQLGNYASRTDKNARNAGDAGIGTLGDTMINYIMAKVNQIKPLATPTELSDFQTLLANTPVPPGSRMYIYMTTPNAIDTTTKKVTGGVISFNATLPPGFVAGTQPDGSTVPGSFTYSLQKNGDCGLMNPHGDWGIHDIMYYQESNPQFSGTDSGELNKSSGFNNYLGKIQFTNQASGSCAMFSKPD